MKITKQIKLSLLVPLVLFPILMFQSNAGFGNQVVIVRPKKPLIGSGTLGTSKQRTLAKELTAEWLNEQAGRWFRRARLPLPGDIITVVVDDPSSFERWSPWSHWRQKVYKTTSPDYVNTVDTKVLPPNRTWSEWWRKEPKHRPWGVQKPESQKPKPQIPKSSVYHLKVVDPATVTSQEVTRIGDLGVGLVVADGSDLDTHSVVPFSEIPARPGEKEYQLPGVTDRMFRDTRDALIGTQTQLQDELKNLKREKNTITTELTGKERWWQFWKNGALEKRAKVAKTEGGTPGSTWKRWVTLRIAGREKPGTLGKRKKAADAALTTAKNNYTQHVLRQLLLQNPDTTTANQEVKQQLQKLTPDERQRLAAALNNEARANGRTVYVDGNTATATHYGWGQRLWRGDQGETPDEVLKELGSDKQSAYKKLREVANEHTKQTANIMEVYAKWNSALRAVKAAQAKVDKITDDPVYRDYTDTSLSEEQWKREYGEYRAKWANIGSDGNKNRDYIEQQGRQLLIYQQRLNKAKENENQTGENVAKELIEHIRARRRLGLTPSPRAVQPQIAVDAAADLQPQPQPQPQDQDQDQDQAQAQAQAPQAQEQPAAPPSVSTESEVEVAVLPAAEAEEAKLQIGNEIIPSGKKLLVTYGTKADKREIKTKLEKQLGGKKGDVEGDRVTVLYQHNQKGGSSVRVRELSPKDIIPADAVMAHYRVGKTLDGTLTLNEVKPYKVQNKLAFPRTFEEGKNGITSNEEAGILGTLEDVVTVQSLLEQQQQANKDEQDWIRKRQVKLQAIQKNLKRRQREVGKRLNEVGNANELNSRAEQTAKRGQVIQGQNLSDDEVGEQLKDVSTKQEQLGGQLNRGIHVSSTGVDVTTTAKKVTKEIDELNKRETRLQKRLPSEERQALTRDEEAARDRSNQDAEIAEIKNKLDQQLENMGVNPEVNLDLSQKIDLAKRVADWQISGAPQSTVQAVAAFQSIVIPANEEEDAGRVKEGGIIGIEQRITQERNRLNNLTNIQKYYKKDGDKWWTTKPTFVDRDERVRERKNEEWDNAHQEFKDLFYEHNRPKIEAFRESQRKAMIEKERPQGDYNYENVLGNNNHILTNQEMVGIVLAMKEKEQRFSHPSPEIVEKKIQNTNKALKSLEKFKKAREGQIEKQKKKLDSLAEEYDKATARVLGNAKGAISVMRATQYPQPSLDAEIQEKVQKQSQQEGAAGQAQVQQQPVQEEQPFDVQAAHAERTTQLRELQFNDAQIELAMAFENQFNTDITGTSAGEISPEKIASAMNRLMDNVAMYRDFYNHLLTKEIPEMRDIVPKLSDPEFTNQKLEELQKFKANNVKTSLQRVKMTHNLYKTNVEKYDTLRNAIIAHNGNTDVESKIHVPAELPRPADNPPVVHIGAGASTFPGVVMIAGHNPGEGPNEETHFPPPITVGEVGKGGY